MTYNAGIIGCGNSGIVHAEVLDSISESSVYAVCDPDKEKRESVSERFDAKAFGDSQELLEVGELDAVHVCSPVQTHHNIAVDSIKNQLPTLIEKPLTRNVSEAENIIQARDNAQIPVGVVHNRVFNPRIMAAKNRVTDGEIGEIIAIDLLTSTESDLSDATRGEWVFDLPGGELGETMPHHVYLALEFVDRLGKIRGVTKHNSRSYQRVDIDGLNIVATDHTGNVNISIRALTNSSEQYELTLFGTDGIMTVDLRRTPGTYFNTTNGFSPKIVIENYLHELSSLIRNFSALIKSELVEKLNNSGTAVSRHRGHYNTIQGFISAVKTGEQVPTELEDGLDTIRVIEFMENKQNKEETATVS